MSSSTVPVAPNEPVPTSIQREEVKASRNAEVNGANGHVEPALNSSAADEALSVQAKYAEERAKRFHPEKALDQYLDITLLNNPKLARFVTDPWLTPRSEQTCLQDGDKIRYLSLGAGFGGVLNGIKLVRDAKVDPNDVYTIDSAGGWGGTWYWNRYPGLMCDISSYVYLPLLEETGYMPKHRYSYGDEIREYILTLVDKYGLDKKAMFRTKVESANWDDAEKLWMVKLCKERAGQPELHLTVYTQFLTLSSGVLNYPKLPNTNGLLDYKGHIFHTSRFDYNYTGGSQANPQLTGLEGKRVGVIGTGATAVQSVPELAKYAKELYIFQRTPSAVNVRGQMPTDQAWWHSVTQKPNWHRELQISFNNLLHGITKDPGDPMTNDAWAGKGTFRASVGGEPVPPDQIPAFVAKLHAEDLPHTTPHRERVDKIVTDPKTAASLKAWYATWCKRPCFHDEYLPTFNKDNVHLIDTDGKGIDRFTKQGIVANGTEYPLDCVIVSTGFRFPANGWFGARANMELRGRNGVSFDERWQTEGAATLHGLMSHDFPNLFLNGIPFQSGATANAVLGLDRKSDHIAYVISQAIKRAGSNETMAKVTIEPTKEAQEEWTKQIMMRATAFAGMAGCTPGYNNGDGMMDAMPMEERIKFGRASPWGDGIEDYQRVVDAWIADGKMEGLEVKT